MATVLTNYTPHAKLLAIAVPLILANITTPLLGLVDTAILGRMDGLHFLAGAAIGSLILTQLYWLCGFLKMSMTGLSAQSKSRSASERNKTLVQGCVLALLLAIMVLLFQSPFLQAGLWFAQAEANVIQSTEAYFYVRVWGAPAALINMAIIGWLIGQQKGRLILVLQVVVNLVNIAASLAFVYVFDLGVQGVAAGTLVAEYSMTVLSLYWINKHYLPLKVLGAWLNFAAMKPLLSLNSNMLIRNLALQFTLAFVTLKGAQYGTQAAAVNAILMQFFALIALGLDGIANAVEALVGEVKGEQDNKHEASEAAPKHESLPENAVGQTQNAPDLPETSLAQQVLLGIFWSSVVALLYTLMFSFAGHFIVSLLTNQSLLVNATMEYFWLIVLLPVIAHWCFLFDGVYVGLTKGHVMRNNMLVSTLCGFLPCYFLFSALGNQALWIAMLVFLAARGFGLGAHFYYFVVPAEREKGA